MRRRGDGSHSNGCCVKQKGNGGNIGKTQEESKLTWRVRATEGTGTCGGGGVGGLGAKQTGQRSVRRRQKEKNTGNCTSSALFCKFLLVFIESRQHLLIPARLIPPFALCLNVQG